METHCFRSSQELSRRGWGAGRHGSVLFMMPKGHKALIGVIAILLGVVVYQAVRIRDQSFRVANLRQRLESAALRAASVRLEGEKRPTSEPNATLKESPQLQRTTDNTQAREAAGISERVEAL